MPPSTAGGTPAATEKFDWPVVKEAENLLRDYVQRFLNLNDFARYLAERMRQETATDLFEWIDHFIVGASEEASLCENGFVENRYAEIPEGVRVYEHPFAMLPSVLIDPMRQDNPSRLVLRVESVSDFKACHGLSGRLQGQAFSGYHYLTAAVENQSELGVVERCGYRGFVPKSLKAGELDQIAKERALWQTRPRIFNDEAEGFCEADRMLELVLPLAGTNRACHFFFEAERAYWQSRNRAARFQKERQDRLGLGWANHDHHTFRCSRRYFVDLISFLMKLGFQKRERYYAGAEAGWGAQILEQPVAGIVVFADVDLLPEETRIDFSTTRLEPTKKLGTVGLWVGLHGESFLEAGMHHLEARFDFVLMEQQLRASGFNPMKPFSNFDFLRQEFTEGELWPVRRERASKLLSDGLITPEQYEQFTSKGAVGSHLENLQRHGGFKGFNQSSVSAVIQATDPRKQRSTEEGSA